MAARFDFCFAALEGGFSIQGIDGKATQKRKIMRGVQRAHPAIIFTKGDIERPVQGIFNAPVLTNGSGNSGTL